MNPEISQPMTPAFFAGMSEKHLQMLANASVFAQFGSGDVIMREGEPANRFYVIEQGKVALEADMDGEGLVEVATLSDGEPLGWSWLFPPHFWHFHARALRRTTARCYDAAELRRLCEEDHEFGYELMRRISEVLLGRLQATRRQMLKLYDTRH